MTGRAMASVTILAWAMLMSPSADSLVRAQNTSTLEIGKFSDASIGAALPDGWKPLIFSKIPKLTQYEVVADDGRPVVKAVSEASASGLTKTVRIDPRGYPILRWSWKVENLLKTSDATRKDGDDYPARLYITFEYDPDKVNVGKKLKYKAGRLLFGDIPIGAINYVWERKAPVDAIIDNAYTDFVKMVVVESGPQKLGIWVDEERNIYDDYKRAFGEEPPMINGVAIMSDTDNTKERTTAYYGDITFAKGR